MTTATAVVEDIDHILRCKTRWRGTPDDADLNAPNGIHEPARHPFRDWCRCARTKMIPQTINRRLADKATPP